MTPGLPRFHFVSLAMIAKRAKSKIYIIPIKISIKIKKIIKI
jgi:hypothetical protein